MCLVTLHCLPSNSFPIPQVFNPNLVYFLNTHCVHVALSVRAWVWGHLLEHEEPHGLHPTDPSFPSEQVSGYLT